MTITNVPADSRRRDYLLAGGETVLPVPFPFYFPGDIQVLRRRAGNTTTLLNPADYVLAGAGAQAGGTLTLAAAGLAGDIITVRSVQPLARTTQFADGAALPASSLNDELNRLVINEQQINTALAGALRVPDDELSVGRIPSRALRASRMLTFDTQGNPVASPVPTPGTTLNGDASLATVVANGTSAARTLGERLADVLYLRDFGAIGDGVADDTAAIDAWIAAVLSTGKPGYFGRGHFRYTGAQFVLIISGLAANQGGMLIGAGGSRTILDVTACTATPQFLVRAGANFTFYWHFIGFEVRGNREGVMAAFGRDWNGSTYPDSLNSGSIKDMVFRNLGTTDAAIAVRFNSVLEHDFHIVANCNNNAQLLGIAIDLQGVGFSVGKMTGGNARYAMRIERFTFGNNFNGELAVCQTAILLNCPSGWNTIGGNFGWGQPNANPALSGINGVGLGIEAVQAGGPLFIAHETIFGQAGNPVVGGAAAFNVRALGRGQGTDVTASLRVQPISSGVDANILMIAPAGRAAQQQLYRDGAPQQLRWTNGMDTVDNIIINRYDASSTFQDTPWYIDQSNGRVIMRNAQALVSQLIPSYIVSTLPAASPAGQIAYVGDGTGNKLLAVSDGVFWRFPDGNPVS